MNTRRKLIIVAAAVTALSTLGLGSANAATDSTQPAEYTPVGITCNDNALGTTLTGVGAGAAVGGAFGGLPAIGGGIIGGAVGVGGSCNHTVDGTAIPEREHHKK